MENVVLACVAGKTAGRGQGQGSAQTTASRRAAAPAAALAANGADDDKGDEDEKEVSIHVFVLCQSAPGSNVVFLVCNDLGTMPDLSEE